MFPKKKMIPNLSVPWQPRDGKVAVVASITTLPRNPIITLPISLEKVAPLSINQGKEAVWLLRVTLWMNSLRILILSLMPSKNSNKWPLDKVRLYFHQKIRLLGKILPEMLPGGLAGCKAWINRSKGCLSLGITPRGYSEVVIILVQTN